jgi:hypothetical protein
VDHDDYAGTIGNYQQHVYGYDELGGTQVMYMSALPFDRLGLPTDVPNFGYPTITEGIQHTLYKWMLAPAILLGGLSFIVYRNTRGKSDQHDDPDRRES